MILKVYGYGTPACVDERLAEACKGKHASKNVVIKGLSNGRVTIKNFLNHDDLIPRLSILTARDFALQLKATRSRWGPLLNEDIASFTSRIKTLWEPQQRAHSLSRGGPSTRMIDSNNVTSLLMEGNPESLKDERLKRSVLNRLVPPGLIVHSYVHHGIVKASLVDFNFAPLRRIEAFPNCIDDHRYEETLRSFRSIRSARLAEQNNQSKFFF